MDGKVLNFAQRLQKTLESLDPQKDRDTFVWTHGFLSGMLKHIESTVPDLIITKTLQQDTRATLDELTGRQFGNSGIESDDRDSLDRIEYELGGADETPVPAKPKRGPKDLIGGAALPLPDGERPM